MDQDTRFEFNIMLPCYVSEVFVPGVQQKRLIDIDNLASKSLINPKQCVDKFADFSSLLLDGPSARYQTE